MMAVQRLARFSVSASLSPGLATVIAPAVADCFGCILAGADSDVATRVTNALSEFGQGQVPIYATMRSTSAPLAAQLNAVAGHAWDLDDWEEPGNTHPTVVILPALLAASHLKPTSGQDLLTAYAIGAETIMRLGEAMSLEHYARGFHSTATLGTIGVAGAAARLLDLNEDQTQHALALSVSQAVGYTLQFGANAKPLQAGWAARNGLEVALLAKQGVTGQAQVLDHARGFAGLMGQYDPVRFESALDKLGNPWALDEYGLVLKPWPSCGYTHRLMSAALELRPELETRLGEITAINARMPDFHAAILPFDQPQTRAEALFSAPACVAQILLTGNLTLSDSEGGFWTHPDAARLIPLTTLTAEPAKRPDLNYDPQQPDVLTVHLANGEVLEAQCAYPLGASQNPMNTSQLGEKYAALTNQPNTAFADLMDWVDTRDVASFFHRMTK